MGAHFRTSLGGGTLIGLWASIPSALTAEATAAAGPDYVVVDHQHGAVGPTEMTHMLIAIQAGGAPPLVRVARNEAFVIGNALDLGAHGVIVPMVETAEQAAHAVAACRYATDGIRSFGALRDPAPGEAPVCLVMIETRTGLENVDEIVRVPGLDGIYIGPSDLALSLGLQPTLTLEHPPVLEAIERVRTACAAAGLLCGLHCLTAEDALKHRDEGFAMVTAGTDLMLLKSGLAATLGTARGAA